MIKRLIFIFGFIGSKKKSYLYWGIGLFIIAISAVLMTNGTQINLSFPNVLDNWWGKFLDPIIGLFTFLLSVFIFFTSIEREALEQLPKKLTVHFMYENEYILTCYEAYLSGESDIRQWSQQIGGQMTSVYTLSFYPYIQQESKVIDYTYKLYTVTFFLRSIPAVDANKDPKRKKEVENNYIVWWDNDIDSRKNSEVIFNKRPQVPKTIEEAKAEKLRQDQAILTNSQ